MATEDDDGDDDRGDDDQNGAASEASCRSNRVDDHSRFYDQKFPICARWLMRTREHGSHRYQRCHFSPDCSRHAPDALQRGF